MSAWRSTWTTTAPRSYLAKTQLSAVNPGPAKISREIHARNGATMVRPVYKLSLYWRSAMLISGPVSAYWLRGKTARQSLRFRRGNPTLETWFECNVVPPF